MLPSVEVLAPRVLVIAEQEADQHSGFLQAARPGPGAFLSLGQRPCSRAFVLAAAVLAGHPAVAVPAIE